MEFIIIPQLILIFSLFGILFILGRNFSKFKKDSEKPSPSLSQEGNKKIPLTPFDKRGNSERGIIQEGNAQDRSLEEVGTRVKKEEEKFKYLCRRLAKRINFQAVQEKYKQFSGAARIKLEKILRKTRIGFLRLDGKFMILIEKLRKRKEKEKEKPSSDPSQEGNNYPPLTSLPKKTGRGEKEINNPFLTSPKKKISKEEEYLEIISKNPGDIDAYWKLGILYSRRRNYKDALNCFKEIARIKPGYEKAKKKVKIISEKLKGN